jgi:hypothetical protein
MPAASSLNPEVLALASYLSKSNTPPTLEGASQSTPSIYLPTIRSIFFLHQIPTSEPKHKSSRREKTQKKKHQPLLAAPSEIVFNFFNEVKYNPRA